MYHTLISLTDSSTVTTNVCFGKYSDRKKNIGKRVCPISIKLGMPQILVGIYLPLTSYRPKKKKKKDYNSRQKWFSELNL